MKSLKVALLLSLLLSAITSLADSGNRSVVILHTNRGDITIQLYDDKSPVTVGNFLNYANSGFYDGTIFHRVMSQFVIQGGGYTEDLREKLTGDPIVNEASINGLHNNTWTVAMARTADPNSARAQFYINVRMNLDLDASFGRSGYTVFGEVTDGKYVVRDISQTPTKSQGIFDNLPVENIVINSVTVNPPGKQ